MTKNIKRMGKVTLAAITLGLLVFLLAPTLSFASTQNYLFLFNTCLDTETNLGVTASLEFAVADNDDDDANLDADADGTTNHVILDAESTSDTVDAAALNDVPYVVSNGHITFNYSYIRQRAREKLASTDAELLGEQEPTNHYVPGDTKTIAIEGIDEKSVTYLELMCVRADESSNCTIWCESETTCPYTDEQFESIEAVFDSNYEKFLDIIGEYKDIRDGQAGNDVKGDADGDGKLAIVFHAAGEDIAGYFDPSDIMLGGENHFDCIHISTEGYPNGPTLDMYSTLFHELQHLYEAVLTDDQNELPLFLNEAFSVSVEHAIFGSDVEGLLDFVDSLNTEFTSERSLTVFVNEMYSYGSSYAFGQYLRTRYAAQTDATLQEDEDLPAGYQVYGHILQNYYGEYEGKWENIAPKLFGENAQEFVQDFWKAVYLKEDSGKYGFNGEEWAEKLAPITTSIDELDSLPIISNGSVCVLTSSNPIRYCVLESDEDFAVSGYGDVEAYEPDPTPTPTPSPDPDPSPTAQPTSSGDSANRLAATGDSNLALGLLVLASVGTCTCAFAYRLSRKNRE